MGCRYRAASQGAAAPHAHASDAAATVVPESQASGGAAPTHGARWPMPNPPSSGLPNAQSYDASGGDTVVDRVTGLVWQRRLAPNTLLWKEANDYCAGLALAGAHAWRLPTLIEMTSLVDFTRSVPAIDRAAFPDPIQGNFWTSTPVADNGVEAWYVAFSTGFKFPGHRDFLRLGTRCVRSSAGASAAVPDDRRYDEVTAAAVQAIRTLGSPGSARSVTLRPIPGRTRSRIAKRCHWRAEAGVCPA